MSVNIWPILEGSCLLQITCLSATRSLNPSLISEKKANLGTKRMSVHSGKQRASSQGTTLWFRRTKYLSVNFQLCFSCHWFLSTWHLREMPYSRSLVPVVYSKWESCFDPKPSSLIYLKTCSLIATLCRGWFIESLALNKCSIKTGRIGSLMQI